MPVVVDSTKYNIIYNTTEYFNNYFMKVVTSATENVPMTEHSSEATTQTLINEL